MAKKAKENKRKPFEFFTSPKMKQYEKTQFKWEKKLHEAHLSGAYRKQLYYKNEKSDTFHFSYIFLRKQTEQNKYL